MTLKTANSESIKVTITLPRLVLERMNELVPARQRCASLGRRQEALNMATYLLDTGLVLRHLRGQRRTGSLRLPTFGKVGNLKPRDRHDQPCQRRYRSSSA